MFWGIFFEWSLAEKYWIDTTHLDPRSGNLIFVFEMIAEIHLEKLKRYDASDETIFESVTYKLVKADELIARVAILEAENTPVKTPKFQLYLDYELAKAHEYLANATAETENYPKALLYYWKSWKHAQKAIKWANKEIGWHCYKRCCMWKH